LLGGGNTHDHIVADELIPMMQSFSKKAALYHERIPGLRQLHLPVIEIILAVGAVNVIVWVGCCWKHSGEPSNSFPLQMDKAYELFSQTFHGRELPMNYELMMIIDRVADLRSLTNALFSIAVLAYTLGLRHALDADHIFVHIGLLMALCSQICSLKSRS
jgi:hypothetical protein